jgi:hypothetical protein
MEWLIVAGAVGLVIVMFGITAYVLAGVVSKQSGLRTGPQMAPGQLVGTSSMASPGGMPPFQQPEDAAWWGSAPAPVPSAGPASPPPPAPASDDPAVQSVANAAPAAPAMAIPSMASAATGSSATGSAVVALIGFVVMILGLAAAGMALFWDSGSDSMCGSILSPHDDTSGVCSHVFQTQIINAVTIGGGLALTGLAVMIAGGMLRRR